MADSQLQKKGNFDLIKHDRCNVYKLKYNDCIYYLKSYMHRKLTKILKNFFRPVEAIRIFQKSMKLIEADIPVAEPVMGLTRRSFFLVDSIFVSKEVPG